MKNKNFYAAVIILTAAVLGIVWLGSKTIKSVNEKKKWERFSAVTAEVIDGDTIRINERDNLIRLLGIDTPELHHPDLPVQKFGKEAKQLLSSLISGKEITVEYDKTNMNDKYGRLLAYVYTKDGVLVNAELVKSGYAYVYTKSECPKTKEFLVLENIARQFKKGVWEQEAGGREMR